MTGDDAEHDAYEESQALELALQYGMRYSGLREVEVDPRLLLYVPLDVCERLEIVPIAIGEHAIEVATASVEPHMEFVGERFPGLEIELVLAPIERIACLHDDLRNGLR
jgi:hypothetical protein